MITPSLVYKYQKINTNSLANLARGILWASHPSEFNDPFEFHFREIGSNPLEDGIHKLIEEFLPAFLKCKVICMSEDPKNILMWSHYSDMHFGMCMELELNPKLLEPVIYTNDLPSFNYEEEKTFLGADGVHYQLNLVRQLLTVQRHKDKDWEYEKEWRIILSEDESREFNYGFGLKKIIFGLRTPSDQI